MSNPHWVALFGATATVLCTLACFQAPEREFAETSAPAPAMFPTPPPVQEVQPPSGGVAVEDHGALPPSPSQCLAPGYYTCEDACPFAHGYMCPELATMCGVTCGVGESLPDWDIEDPCAWGGFRLVITPLATGPECAAAQWLGSPCNEQFQAYCCSKDGSPLPASE